MFVDMEKFHTWLASEEDYARRIEDVNSIMPTAEESKLAINARGRGHAFVKVYNYFSRLKEEVEETDSKTFARLHSLLPRDLRVDFENDYYNIVDDKERHINRFRTPQEILAWCEGLLEDTVSTNY